MRKLIFAISSIVFLSFYLIPSAWALSPTPKTSPATETSVTPETSPTDETGGEKLNAQINQLKERIASKVAELNLVEKRGIIGDVNEASGTQITFTDLAGNKRFIDVDEITKFASPSAKSSFGISDLNKGTRISVLGQYNRRSERILGRFINVYTMPTYVSGRISELDKKNFTVSVLSENKKITKVDIEDLTIISIYEKDSGISKYGFSKLNIGDRVMAMGFFDVKNPVLLLGSRILVLSGLTDNPNIMIEEPTSEASISPSVKTSISPTKTIDKSPSPTIKLSPTSSKTAIKTPTPSK